MAEKIFVTQEGLDELRAELENLVHVVRPEVINELQEARAQGDFAVTIRQSGRFYYLSN